MVDEKYETNDQQDVTEFLLALLSFMHDIYEETFLEEETPISKGFSIKTSEDVTCMKCLKNRVRPVSAERILTCPLGTGTVVTVEDVIKKKFETEIVERQCDSCTSDSHFVTNNIDEISDTLIVQLNRFTNDIEKNCVPISISENLKL